MAEVVGIVASGAGLVSLALQLADLAEKFRKRCEHLGTIQNTAKELYDDINMNTGLLHYLENEHLHILEFQLGPVMLNKCLTCGHDVGEKLERLVQKLSNPPSSSFGRALSMTLKSKVWKAEVAELKVTVAEFKQDINTLICLLSLQQGARMRKQFEALRPTLETDSQCHTAPSPSAENNNPTPDFSYQFGLRKPHRISCCAIKHCHCSCHNFQRIKGRFWFLQYTPVATILATCDNAACTSRRYRIDFRIALSRLGLSWAAVLGVTVTSELGRFHLKPALEVQRVVKYTAPGFDTLFELSEGGISWEVAKVRFDALHKSDPGFIRQVDPEGLGFLEKVLQYGSWQPWGWDRFETQSQLLSHFTKNFGMSFRVATIEVLYSCMVDYDPACIIEQLVGLGFDFSGLPSPSFEGWQKPCIADDGPNMFTSVKPDDPFFLQLIRTLVQSNPDFGGTTTLQEAVLLGSLDDCKSLIRNAQTIETDVNFLGQTLLHLAVDHPPRLKLLLDSGHNVDVRDKNGATPLMYAAALGLTESVSILIERGADLFVRDSMEDSDFINYAAMRSHWSLIWQAVDAVEIRDRNLLLSLFSRIKSISGPPLFTKDGREYVMDFWRSILAKLRDFDVCFEDGSTLLHVAQFPRIAKALIAGRYTLFDHQDNNGEHCLFALSRFLDPSLLQLCVGKGVSINLRNNQGMTVLHKLLDHLQNPRMKEVKGILNCLDTLVDAGTDTITTDNCVCGCSSYGCLPASDLKLDSCWFFGQHIYNPFWIFEWLYMLEEREQIQAAKTSAIAIIRKSRFDSAGLRHKCHSYGNSIYGSEDEDKFWDIESQVKLDRLNSEMRIFELSSYDDVKLSLLREIQSIADRELGPSNKAHTKSDSKQSNIASSTESEPIEYRIDYEKDCLHSQLDRVLRGEVIFDIDTESISAQECIDICFSEFVSGLRDARGEKFSSRLPMIRQMAKILRTPLSV